MNRKLLAILAALLLTVSLCACGDKEEETTDGGINIGGDTQTEATGDETDEDDTDNDTEDSDESEDETQAPEANRGNPGEYEYTTLETPETVYVHSATGAANLRDADFNKLESIENGVSLERVGVSTDAEGYWSKVVYKGETCYIASNLVTTIADPDAGFVACDKTVQLIEGTGSMNVRDLPSTTEGKVIGYVYEGEEIKVIAVNTVDGWYKVEGKDGEGTKVIGYVAANPKYIEVETEAATEATTEAGTEGATEAGTETGTEAAGA